MKLFKKKESEMASLGKVLNCRKIKSSKIRTRRHKIPNMSSMIDKNQTVDLDNEYLSSQVNNFNAILNSLRNERY